MADGSLLRAFISLNTGPNQLILYPVSFSDVGKFVINIQINDGYNTVVYPMNIIVTNSAPTFSGTISD
jgi:hypothetical protein